MLTSSDEDKTKWLVSPEKDIVCIGDLERNEKVLNNINEESAFTSKRLEMFQELNLKIEKLMNQQSLCYELFCVGKMLEVKIEGIYESMLRFHYF